jgi:glycosyl transferase family 25
MNLKVLIISLKTSLQRRDQVRQQMENTELDWEFLDAIDGRLADFTSLLYDARKVKKLLGFELTNGEIGCYMSHIQCWKYSIENHISVLIFEDDFIIKESFPSALNLLDKIHLNWQILRLQGLAETNDLLIYKIGNNNLCFNGSDPLGTAAYIVKPEGAKILLNNSSEIYEPIDHFIEHYEKHGLMILAFKPYPITTLDTTLVESTIQDRLDRLPIQGIKKVKRSYWRIIDRLSSKNPFFPKLRQRISDNFLHKYFQTI